MADALEADERARLPSLFSFCKAQAADSVGVKGLLRPSMAWYCPFFPSSASEPSRKLGPSLAIGNLKAVTRPAGRRRQPQAEHRLTFEDPNTGLARVRRRRSFFRVLQNECCDGGLGG